MRSSKRNRNSDLKKACPATLYKYVTDERFDIVRNQRIRFTQPSALNDPFEVRPVFSGWSNKKEIKSMLGSSLQDSVNEIIAKHPAIKESDGLVEVIKGLIADKVSLVEEDFCNLMKSSGPLIDRGFGKAIDRVSVLSLTEDRNNLLMWAHYAAQHMGLVIGFDSGHKFINHKLHEDDEFRHPRPVVYTKHRPQIDFSYLSDNSDYMFAQFFLTKSREWGYEKEWRVIEASSSAAESRTLENGGVSIYFWRRTMLCEKLLSERERLIIQWH